MVERIGERRRGGAGESVIKARQELRRDERTAAPEDTARDLCDSDIQPANIAEPQKRFSAYRLVTSRPPTDIASPICKYHCVVEIGKFTFSYVQNFLDAKEINTTDFVFHKLDTCPDLCFLPNGLILFLF